MASVLYDAISIHDTHLGASNSQIKKLRRFLHKLRKGKKLATKLLILNGDILDSMKLGKLKKKHLKVLKQIKKLQKKMRVVWTIGNHDYNAKVIAKEFGIDSHRIYIRKRRPVNICNPRPRLRRIPRKTPNNRQCRRLDLLNQPTARTITQTSKTTKEEIKEISQMRKITCV